jgi:hypothetical protein
MDKHPIETWHQLVHSMLHPVRLLQSAPEAIDDYLATSKDLKEALRIQLLRDTLYCKTEMEIALWVEHYQTISANLINRLFHYQHYGFITGELNQFYQEVTTQLQEIIDLLQNDYGRYFNADLNLPLPLCLQEGLELKRYRKSISCKLNHSASNNLIVKSLDQYIKNLRHQNEESAVTYRQVSYFKNLLKELSGYLSATVPTPGNTSIIELLIKWNFNDITFIQNVCIGFRMEVEKLETDELRLEFLRTRQKQVSQLLEISNVAFHPEQPSAKQTILEWIAQEITWFEKTAIVSEKIEINEGIKIHTSIPVPVLALITRLFKESGIVTNTKQTEIVKFFATHFTTLHKSEFSFAHLHNKYYNVDEGTKKKVHGYLMEMIMLCKKL